MCSESHTSLTGRRGDEFKLLVGEQNYEMVEAEPDEDTPLLDKSSRWQQSLNVGFITSTFSEDRERRERRRRLHTSQIGAAAFLVRDAILGTSKRRIGSEIKLNLFPRLPGGESSRWSL